MKQTINITVEIETLEEKCSHTCRFLGSEHNAFGSSMVCYLYDEYLITEENDILRSTKCRNSTWTEKTCCYCGEDDMLEKLKIDSISYKCKVCEKEETEPQLLETNT